MEVHERALRKAQELIDREGWTQVSSALERYARRLIQRRSWKGIPGSSAEAGSEDVDFAQTAIERFLDGQRRWNPDPEVLRADFIKDALLLFLLGVVKSLVYHEAELLENQSTIRIHPISEHGGGGESTAVEHIVPLVEYRRDQAEEVEFEEELNNLLARCAHDPLLGRMVRLIVEAEGTLPARDIAAILNVEIQEIYNALKRLRRIFEDQKPRGNGVTPNEPQRTIRSS